MRTVYVNIETSVPLGVMVDPSSIKAPKNYKDPDKIREYQLREALERYDRIPLHPLQAQVVCFTTLVEGETDPEVYLVNNERVLFDQIEEWISVIHREGQTPIRWCSYNGIRFDYPLLRLRGAKYGKALTASEFTTRTRYPDHKHSDLFQQLGEPGTLDEVAAFFGTSTYDNEIHGSEIRGCLALGHHDKIIRHTRSRVLILRDIDLIVNGGVAPVSTVTAPGAEGEAVAQ